jgi:hypothetical protein
VFALFFVLIVHYCTKRANDATTPNNPNNPTNQQDLDHRMSVVGTRLAQSEHICAKNYSDSQKMVRVEPVSTTPPPRQSATTPHLSPQPLPHHT